MNKEELKAFIQKWIDSHEPDTFIKSDIESEGYWYTSKDGSASINLSVFFEELLQDYKEMEEKQQWIDVRERQPELFQPVAFVVKSQRPPYYNNRVFGGTYLGNRMGYYEFAVPGIGFEGTHWMPLPEPPKPLTHE